MSTYDPSISANVKGDLTHERVPLPGSVTVGFEKVSNGQRLQCKCQLPGGIDLAYEIFVANDSPVTRWRIKVENRGGATPAEDRPVYRVAFPVSWATNGPRHESNFLARPYAQGELIPNPSDFNFREYLAESPLNNVLTYPGWASMSWQDLYSADGGGLYLASYDPTFQQIDLECWPNKAAGSITLDVRTLAFLEPGKSWESQPFAVGIHEGDWHSGPRIAIASGHARIISRTRDPNGFEKNATAGSERAGHSVTTQIISACTKTPNGWSELRPNLVADARECRARQIVPPILLLPVARS